MAMTIKMKPAATSSLREEAEAIFLPKNAAREARRKVTVPMTATAVQIFVSRKAKERPTAKASMLVATARSNSGPHREGSKGEHSRRRFRELQIIRPPKATKRAAATQWSTGAMMKRSLLPKSHPRRGMSAWKRPKAKDIRKREEREGGGLSREQEKETATASMARATARTM